MNQVFSINGGNKLEGVVEVGGSKNAAFPILAASILMDESVLVKRVPKIKDIMITLDILRSLGIQVNEVQNSEFNIVVPDKIKTTIPSELGMLIRGSLYFLGALLTKMKKAVIPIPGGCKIGKRGFSVHLDALKQMGAHVNVSSTEIEVSCDTLVGQHIKLPFPSRGVTGNIMMVATRAKGITVIENADTSPEIVSMGSYLTNMGVKIRGLGTSRIEIEPINKPFLISSGEFTIPPDKIGVATLLVAGLVTKGEITVKKVIVEDVKDFLGYLHKMNVPIIINKDEITVKWSKNIKGIPFVTGFPPMIDPDYEPILIPLLSLLNGTHLVKDGVNEERHGCFLPELVKMGANITVVDNNTAYITGCDSLNARKDLYGKDIRGGVSLVIAALSASGNSIIHGIDQIDRGYERLEKQLQQIGAKIERKVI